MLANVYCKTQTFKRVDFNYDAKLNLYSLKNVNTLTYVPNSEIQYVVALEKPVQRPTRKHRSTKKRK